jgi:5-methylthioadenosine/S-adenosylhomocysteine deaminase
MKQWIVADHVFVNDGLGTVFEPGIIEIDEGIIVSAGAATGKRPSGHSVTDLGPVVIMPGLVNAHAHTPMSLMRGVAEGHSLLTMEGFLSVLRSREAHLSPDLVAASVAVSCADMIRHGTTAFADQYFYADQIAPTVVESGLRATIAWGIVELGDNTARERELTAATKFAESISDGTTVRGWIGPHAYFVDNRPEAMAVELALAHRLHAGLHVHFSTSGEEDRYCYQHHGKSALTVMKEMGMLEVPTILAHCNTVRTDELPLLVDTKAAMTVIPSVAMASGAPAAPVREALDAGVTVALGSDNACNNTNLDLFEEMRTLGKLAAFTSKIPNQITPREILNIATVGGHTAIDSGAHAGRLVAGGVADLIAVPVRHIQRGPVGAQSLEAALVYCTSGASVSHSMVDGRWIMTDRTPVNIDVGSALSQQQIDYDTLTERMRPDREPTNDG